MWNYTGGIVSSLSMAMRRMEKEEKKMQEACVVPISLHRKP
jgi:hypothetical protein